MSDNDDHGAPRLRVDRLAAAMDAARARARAATDTSAANAGAGSGTVPQVPPLAPWDARGDIPERETDATGGAEMPGPSVTPQPDWTASAAPPIAPHQPVIGQLDADADADADAGNADPVLPAGPTLATGPLLLTDDFLVSPEGDEPVPDTAATAIAANPVADPPDRPPAIVTAPMPRLRVADVAQRPALLTLSHVATDVAGHRTLHDMNFDVPKGAVTMLLGRNGAGKTTTLRTVMGLARARAGEIVLAGTRIDRWSTVRIARAGVGYVPDSMSIFSDLTVAENIALGARSRPLARDRLDWLTGLFPPLATCWRSPAGSLPVGQQQLLALARALAERHRLYLFDEPTNGLPPALVDSVVAALRDLKLQGATILLVDQNFAVARALGDVCVTMDDGRVTWRGPMADLAEDGALQSRLLRLTQREIA